MLFGAVSIFLTFLLARRFLPPAFAATAALLLAADPMFLLTGCFDWGPVALQHLLALLMVWAAMRTQETRHWTWAGAAGIAAGLGIWDKISFLWLLAGLLAAVLVMGGGQALRVWRNWRLSAAAVVGAVIGSAPFLRYNLRFDMASFRATAGLDFTQLGMKVKVLWLTLDGSALFGFLVNDSGRAGWLSASVQGYVLLAALAAIPFLPEYRRSASFLATWFGVTFFLMVVMKNAGDSAHHTILLWPLPQLLIVAAAAGLWSRGSTARWLTALSIVAVVVSGLLVTGRYIHLAREEGPGSQWTPASALLARRLEQSKAPAIFVADWGILDPLRLNVSGRLPLLAGSDTVVVLLDRLQGDWRLALLKDRNTLVVTHPVRLLNFAGANERLDAWAAGQGLRKVPVEEVADKWGVTQFELYRYEPK